MNQQYAEAGVKRKGTASSMAIRSLMIIGFVIGVFLLFLGGIFGIIGAVLIVGMFFLFPRLNVEYEYVFVDGQLDFDRITGKSRRKTMLRIDFEQVEIMAPANSHSLDSYANNQIIQKDFSSGDKESKPYVIIANAENKRYRILFEPNENMIAVIKQKNLRKVVQY